MKTAAEVTPPKTIAVGRFKATCLRLLEEVHQTGKSIVITKRGVPLAIVSPPPGKLSRKEWFGSARGTARILGDIVSPIVKPKKWEVLRK